MTDQEVSALVAAVRTVVDEQTLAVRAQVASLSAAVDELRTEVQSLRGADERAEKLLNAFARQASEALPLAVAGAVDRHNKTLATRVAVLEQRAMPTEAAAS